MLVAYGPVWAWGHGIRVGWLLSNSYYISLISLYYNLPLISQDKSGESLLMKCARGGLTTSTKVLLGYEINPETTNAVGAIIGGGGTL